MYGACFFITTKKSHSRIVIVNNQSEHFLILSPTNQSISCFYHQPIRTCLDSITNQSEHLLFLSPTSQHLLFLSSHLVSITSQSTSPVFITNQSEHLLFLSPTNQNISCFETLFLTVFFYESVTPVVTKTRCTGFLTENQLQIILNVIAISWM